MITEPDKPLHQETDVEVTSDSLEEEQEFKTPEVEHVYMGIPNDKTKEEEGKNNKAPRINNTEVERIIDITGKSRRKAILWHLTEKARKKDNGNSIRERESSEEALQSSGTTSEN